MQTGSRCHRIFLSVGCMFYKIWSIMMRAICRFGLCYMRIICASGHSYTRVTCASGLCNTCGTRQRTSKDFLLNLKALHFLLRKPLSYEIIVRLSHSSVILVLFSLTFDRRRCWACHAHTWGPAPVLVSSMSALRRNYVDIVSTLCRRYLGLCRNWLVILCRHCVGITWTIVFIFF